MHFNELIAEIRPIKQIGVADQEIRGLCYDSRQVIPGSLYFALRGTRADGHDYLAAAAAQGAVGAVVENAAAVPAGLPYLQVASARQTMATLAAKYYGDPTGSGPLVGITGTNGKTTTTYLVEGILAAAGIPAGVLGTISYRFGDIAIEASHTTPESVELQAALRQLADAGAKSFVMEVSSHALEQYRVDGCRFDLAIFTNLTRDHLDYHGTMDAYLQSKLRLFRELLAPAHGKGCRTAVINLDDPAAESFLAAAAGPTLTYGQATGAAVTAREVTFSTAGIHATLVTPVGTTELVSPLLGRFNLSNLLAAAASGVALGLPLTAIVAGLRQHRTVPGRLERVPEQLGITVLVDYAHTGDALENVLQTLVELKPRRMITVFGCGGDRDRGKRPLMGEIAVRFSDLAIVTSDNPRTEEPQAILADILAGITPLGLREYQPAELATGEITAKGFATIADRRAAIRAAIAIAEPGDIVLLAGKGHEDYQIIGTVKHHFDDREEAAAALAARGSC
jgi:UDP-N-acetylmuramoyl-L-alanyl-D-glutamate--2,6-diaminopimelate ligase